MNKTFKIFLTIAVAVLSLASCDDDENFTPTDEGPEMTIVSCPSSAYMGEIIPFEVTLTDPIDLSTLKAKLLFDEEEVSTTTLRTKTNGTYQDTLEVPFLADIPDGDATIVFIGENIRWGKTYDTLTIAISRPDFDYLTLVGDDGNSYTMTMDAQYEYSYTGTFDAEYDAYIVSAPFGEYDTQIEFGYSSGEVVAGSTTVIPFQNGIAGEYTISLNTFSLEASPFLTLTIAGVTATQDSDDSSKYYVVTNLTQGQTVAIEGYAAGFSGWDIDPDWFETIEEGSYEFLAVSGMYKVIVCTDDDYILVEAMDSSSETGTLSSSYTGAIWLIGNAYVGKPLMSGYSWSPENGGVCLAQQEEGKFQVTLTVGTQLAYIASDVNFKFYHQKTWGDEFGYENISLYENGWEDYFYVSGPDSDSGNIMASQNLTPGDVLKFTIDLTSASGTGNDITGAVLVIEKVGESDVDVEEESISFAGTEMELTSTGIYTCAVELTQGQSLTVTGISDYLDWYYDCDYVTVSGSSLTFVPVSGYYEVEADTINEYFTFRKLASDGSYATLADGGLWMMGWGIAATSMSAGQFGWDTSNAGAVAQVSEGVYQMTGTAVSETSTELGGKFRYDWVGFKYYMYKGWDHGETGTVTFIEGSDLLTQGSDGNFGLVSSLEEGETYRLTIYLDNSAYTYDGGYTGSESVSFVKLGDDDDSGNDSDDSGDDSDDDSDGDDSGDDDSDDDTATSYSFGGTEMTESSTGVYTCSVNLTQGGTIALTGFDDIADWYIDPDYLTLDGTTLSFVPVSGYYEVEANTSSKYFLFRKLASDGSYATLSDGGLWMLGWGISFTNMADGQFGWDTSNAGAVAQVSDGTFQITGTAVAETSTEMGGKFRYDWVGFKYYMYKGWDHGETGTVTFTDGSSAYLTQGSDGNFGLSANLEEGATYRMTIVLDTSAYTYDGGYTGSETVTFEKL